MSQSDASPALVSPHDHLPPVEPPTAGFILQLFVVPAMIVGAIVLVWVLFNWLAQMGSNPRSYLQQIEKYNANSWIAASRLADELRTKEALRQDPAIARQLADMLDRSITAARMDSESVNLRAFLCQALGHFEVPEGVPALARAATTERGPEEVVVRRWALEGIARLIGNVRAHGSAGWSDERLLEAILECSADSQAEIRETAAYGLGIMGGAKAIARLEAMVDDEQPSVRFNAATGLARHGNEKSVGVLVEMLDLKALDAIGERLASADLPQLKAEEQAAALDAKKTAVLLNALRAAGQLVEANPAADSDELGRAIDKLLRGDLRGRFSRSDIPVAIEQQARQVRATLSQPRAARPKALATRP